MTTPGSQTSLREANQRRVIHAVRASGAPTQADIARSTGLSRATVSNIVRELTVGGILLGSSTILPGWAGIHAADEATSRLGRPVGRRVRVHRLRAAPRRARDALDVGIVPGL